MSQPNMKLEVVKSSNITHLGYDEGNSTLYVRFKDSGDYSHTGVTPEEVEAFKAADSLGSHYHRFIKSKYPGVKCGETIR